MTAPSWTRDLAILLARIVVGLIFMAHGWQKFATNGVEGTAAFFGQVGIPLPTVAAWFSTLVELIGGAALIVGAAVPVAALLLVMDMAGAYLFVHVGNGVFADQGGFELVGALGAFSLVLAVIGAGRYSVDHLALGRRRKSGASATAHR